MKCISTLVTAQAPARYFDDKAEKRGSGLFGPGPRCALCASDLHLMDSCPLAICHRCLRPGHAARDCREPPRQMPELCTACGAVGHSWKWCEATDGEVRGRRGFFFFGSLRGSRRRRGCNVDIP